MRFKYLQRKDIAFLGSKRPERRVVARARRGERALAATDLNSYPAGKVRASKSELAVKSSGRDGNFHRDKTGRTRGKGEVINQEHEVYNMIRPDARAPAPNGTSATCIDRGCSAQVRSMLFVHASTGRAFRPFRRTHHWKRKPRVQAIQANARLEDHYTGR